MRERERQKKTYQHFQDGVQQWRREEKLFVEGFDADPGGETLESADEETFVLSRVHLEEKDLHEGEGR